jgi:putative hydrolases of HD superfamily
MGAAAYIAQTTGLQMKTKGGLPVGALDDSNPMPLIAAYFELDQLKQLYRQGWLRRGVAPEQCESVAEHVFAMAMLGWWLVDAYFPNLDRDKILRMVLVHELGEIYAGDIIPADQMDRAEKLRQERAGLIRVTGKLPGGPQYLALWEEFEAGETAEAVFVRQIDRLEMAFQAAVYRRQGYASMEEFFASAEAAVDIPELREILAALKAL